MSATFMRGLALLEIVADSGPIGVSDIARRLDADKAGVSRMVTAAERDGWVRRVPDGVVLGPRLPVVAHHLPLAGTLQECQELADAVAGITGLYTQLHLLVGGSVVPAVTSGRPPFAFPTPPSLEVPLWGTAGGLAVAALMDPVALRAGLPADPLPWPESAVAMQAEVSASDRLPELSGAEFLAAVEGVRVHGFAYDFDAVIPGISCIAAPWPSLPEFASLAIVDVARDMETRRGLIEAVLRAATSPGASRDTIVQAAAKVR